MQRNLLDCCARTITSTCLRRIYRNIFYRIQTSFVELFLCVASYLKCRMNEFVHLSVYQGMQLLIIWEHLLCISHAAPTKIVCTAKGSLQNKKEQKFGHCLNKLNFQEFIERQNNSNNMHVNLNGVNKSE